MQILYEEEVVEIVWILSFSIWSRPKTLQSSRDLVRHGFYGIWKEILKDLEVRGPQVSLLNRTIWTQAGPILGL